MVNAESTVPAYMTAKEAAAYLRVSPKWLYLQTAKKTIPFLHVGPRAIRFKRDDLDRWMSKNVSGPQV